MDREHSRIIVWLLAGILAVLLFGAAAVRDGLQVAFWVGLALLVVFLTWKLVSGVWIAASSEIAAAKEQGEPWLWAVFLIPAGFWIAGMVTTAYVTGNRTKFPYGYDYWEVPVFLAAAGLALLLGGVLRRSYKQIPGLLWRFYLGWLAMIAAPWLMARRTWSEYREMNMLRFPHIFWTFFMTFYSILIGMMFFIIALVFPLIGISAVASEIFRLFQ